MPSTAIHASAASAATRIADPARHSTTTSTTFAATINTASGSADHRPS